MNMKHTKELVNERLKNRDIELVGNYINANTRSLFRCAHAHEWFAKPGDVIFGQGCRKCSDESLRLRMKDKVIQVLKERNIIMIDEYQTMATKGRFQCQHHHEWISSADNIIRKNSNCPVCFYDTKRLTTEVIRNRLKNSDIELVGEYLGSVRKKQKFICRNGHTFVSRVNSILNTKLCVICSSGGGFDVNKSSYAYIIRFNSFIKYGITGNLDQRLAHHRKSGDFIVVAVMFFESGRDALVWETSVKRDHGGNFVSSNHLANGFTETLSLDKEQIIVQTLRLSKQKN